MGPNFRGVKMVPPGAHFVSSNAVSSQRSAAAAVGGSDVAPTASFFIDVALREVVIRRWDKEEELLLPLEDADEVSAADCMAHVSSTRVEEQPAEGRSSES